MDYFKKLVNKASNNKSGNAPKTESQVNDSTLKDLEKNLAAQQRNKQIAGILNVLGEQLTE